MTPIEEIQERYKAVWLALDHVDKINTTQRKREQMDTLLSYIRGDIRLLLRAQGLTPEQFGQATTTARGERSDK